MEQNSKKILILYAAIGLGHKSIAENIGYYLSMGGHAVILKDVQKTQGGFLVKWGTKLYSLLLGWFPFVWSWAYKSNWFINLTLPYRTRVAGKNYQNILTVINQEKPDTIITTHTTASAIIDYLKSQRLYNGRFGIAFSDFHLNRYWLYERADFYLANIEEQRQEMTELGISQDKIFVCGVILKPKTKVNILALKQKLEIKLNQKVILIASGSQGTGVDENLINDLLKKSEAKIIVVCGKNKALFEALSARYQNANTTILGYYAPMEELYAVADLFITKPGGLSTAEALRYNLPILVSHLLPGQEELNCNYLQAKGLIMHESGNLVADALGELLAGKFRQNLANNPSLLAFYPAPEEFVKIV